jgi:hypothetical protein
LPAVLGEIIHNCLDVILRKLYERGCSSIDDAAATEALRDLGGYSALVEREIAMQVDALQSNPRMTSRVGVFRTTLRTRLPEIRQRVQTMVARARLVPTSGVRVGRPESETRAPLREGTHPEVSLSVPGLHLAGRADLLTVTHEGCAITDYKTGSPSEHHAEQVRMYQLLWSRDSDRNPDEVPVTTLTLSYATHEASIDPLDPKQLTGLADDLARRVQAAEREVARRPPPARPVLEMCKLCSVRHLCEDYWASSATGDDGRDFVDRQGTIAARNGPKSWLLESHRPQRERILLRTTTEQPGFDVGEEVRLLDVVFPRDDDAEMPILTMTASSEVFVVADAR